MTRPRVDVGDLVAFLVLCAGSALLFGALVLGQRWQCEREPSTCAPTDVPAVTTGLTAGHDARGADPHPPTGAGVTPPGEGSSRPAGGPALTVPQQRAGDR